MATISNTDCIIDYTFAEDNFKCTDNVYMTSLVITVNNTNNDLCIPIDCINGHNFQNTIFGNETVLSLIISMSDTNNFCATSQPSGDDSNTLKRFTTELIIVAASSGGGGAIIVSVCALILLFVKWKVNSHRKRTW